MVVSKRVPPAKSWQTSGLNTKGSATCHPFSTLALYKKKNTKHKGYEYRPILLQPKQSCWNVRPLLSGLGRATCGQRAVKSPWMLHLPPLGRLAKKEIYWPIYMIYHLSFAHWCSRTMRQGMSKVLLAHLVCLVLRGFCSAT
jgi:hypothetical protein